jgi:hypothetical protein
MASAKKLPTDDRSTQHLPPIRLGEQGRPHVREQHERQPAEDVANELFEPQIWKAGRTAATITRLSTDQLADRLIRARETVPFVQANLIARSDDEAELVARWRERLQRHGVWANHPVPLYPYPSSPD